MGYTYLGSASLYNLTWIEILRLTDGITIEKVRGSGVRQSDLTKFEQYQQKLEAKHGG